MFMIRKPMFFMEQNGDPKGDPQSQSPQTPEPKTFTQEELDKAIAEATAKFKDYDDKMKQLEELQKAADDKKTDVEKLTEKLAELEKTIAEKDAANKKMQVEALKQKLCSEAGLSAALAGRISGEDEKSIKEDIEALKKILPVASAGGKGAPGCNGDKTPKDPKKAGETLRSALADFYNKE